MIGSSLGIEPPASHAHGGKVDRREVCQDGVNQLVRERPERALSSVLCVPVVFKISKEMLVREFKLQVSTEEGSASGSGVEHEDRSMHTCIAQTKRIVVVFE